MGRVIKIEKLGKKYILGHQKKERYVALRDVIADSFKSSLKRIRDPFGAGGAADPSREDFWALSDVSFDVKQGERIGVIGRNGAGKSTLLKVLSRITDPTKGRVSIKGRVASLLEVGTGFHPELTGRENIFLNGAVLGMKRNEIRQKFDEIVAFAEIEKFLDTPVKRYSSGMYVRLAFAVAAHLEPEILIVDEVLAVGDAQFQKKCLGKMEDVSSKEGRTVIFVSHNMNAIRGLCQRAVLLNSGKLVEDGDANSVVDNYISNIMKESSGQNLNDRLGKIPADPVFKFKGIDLRQSESAGLRFCAEKDIEIEFSYEVLKDQRNLFVSFELCDTDGNILLETFHNADGSDPVVRRGNYLSRAVIPADSLAPISYELRIYCGIYGERNFHSGPISVLFSVYSESVKKMVYSVRSLGGRFILPIRWDTKQTAAAERN